MIASPTGDLPAHLVDFVEALRRHGVNVGPSETVDAGQVMSVLDLMDRDALREGLACALLRRSTHRPTFDTLFDLWFPRAIGTREGSDAEVDLPRTSDGEVDLDALRDVLAELLADDSPDAVARSEALVASIVDELGRYKSGKGPSFSAYQALRQIEPDAVLTRLLEGLLGRGGDDGVHEGGAYADEVLRRTASTRVNDLRAMIERETRRRSAENLGKERVASYGVPRIAEEVDFLRASDKELVALRRGVAPLARLLASRLAARRSRARAGSIDIRRTMRRSLSTGGVPIDLVLKKPRPGRPELVVLCDVSGSVAGFSQFTLLLVHTLREQFSRVRVFAFIDSVDEVTEYFDSGAEFGTSMTSMIRDSALITFDGHSDYGHSFVGFAEKYLHVLTPSASLIVLGDGRNNYRNPETESLTRMVDVAKHAHWLNPEPKSQWGSGDSAADVYRSVVTMHECRSAKQLAAVVGSLLPV